MHSVVERDRPSGRRRAASRPDQRYDCRVGTSRFSLVRCRTTAVGREPFVVPAEHDARRRAGRRQRGAASAIVLIERTEASGVSTPSSRRGTMSPPRRASAVASAAAVRFPRTTTVPESGFLRTPTPTPASAGSDAATHARAPSPRCLGRKPFGVLAARVRHEPGGAVAAHCPPDGTRRRPVETRGSRPPAALPRVTD